MRRTEAVIIDAIRPPIGEYGGILRDVHPNDLSTIVIKALIERTKIYPASIDNIMWDCEQLP